MTYLSPRPQRRENQPRTPKGTRACRDKIALDPGLRAAARQEAAAYCKSFPLFAAEAIAFAVERAHAKREKGLVEWPGLTDEATLAVLEHCARARGQSVNTFLHWLIYDHDAKTVGDAA